MSDEHADRVNAKKSRALRLRRALGLSVFLCVATILITLIVHFALLRRSTSGELARAQEIHGDLQEMVDRIDWTTNQASADKRVVWNLLRQCRETEDIPDLQNDHVFSSYQSGEKLVMYIPAGSHELEISANWKPGENQNPSLSAKTGEPGPSGEKTWRIPVSGSGYILKLASERKGGPIEWELTGNHPGFKPQSGAIPLEGFSHTGTSWSSLKVGQFPGQVSSDLFLRPAGITVTPPAAKLFAVTLLGSHLEQSYEVRVEVRLLSDTPACVSASDAQRLIILKRGDVLLPYEGGGKYEVRLDK